MNIGIIGMGDGPTSIYIADDAELKSIVTILLFTEGTVLGPKNILGLYFHGRYVPIGGCVEKIRSWAEQGAEIAYITSRKSEKQVNVIRSLLTKYCFPGTRLYYREKRENTKFAFEVDDVRETLKEIIAEGGGQVGDVAEAVYPNGIKGTFVYAKDIEGNIIGRQKLK